MEKNFTIPLELITLIFSAYCLAAIANTMLGPAPIHEVATTSTASMRVTPKKIPAFSTVATVVLKRNAFNIFSPATKKVATPPPKKKLTDIAVAKLKTKLLGTIYSSSPELRRAIVSDKEDRILKVGERVQGLRILEIQRRAIVLDRKGKKELLLIDRNDASIAEQAKNSFEISRKWLQGQTQNLARLAQEIILKPADYGKGKKGIVVHHLKKKSQFRQWGLRIGDLILDINGQDITKFRHPLEAFQLVDTNELVLNIYRSGKNIPLTYTITD